MSRGLHLLGAATDSASSYEADAYADGRRHYSENPNAAGYTDEYGRFIITEVPGWHLFNTYYDWFRRGFADAKRGVAAVGADPTKTAGAVFSALAEGLAGGAAKQRVPAQAAAQPPPAAPLPPAAPPPAPEKSNTVWYVAGGGAVLAILVALLARSR